MSLEAKWNAAAATSNAGKAKALVTAVETGAGLNTATPVNYFDGTARPQYDPAASTAPAADALQIGFVPNQAGSYRYGANSKVGGKYAESRFVGEVPAAGGAVAANAVPAWVKSKALFADLKYNSQGAIADSAGRNAGSRVFHTFTPNATFKQSTVLSEFAKGRI